jgi:hypothetical protein
MERWWDGSTWTEYTRTAPAPQPAQPVYPGYPSGDVIASPGGSGSRNNRNAVIAIVVALVLIGGVVAGVIALGKGGKNDDASTPPPAPAASGTPNPGQGGRGTSPTDPGLPQDPGTQGPGTRGDSTKAVDAYDGISLPVLDGWQGTSGDSGIGSSVVTSEYACPGDATKSCVRGGVFAQPAAALKITATGAEAAAKADIAPNAANSYSVEIYGATTSHQQIAAKSVTVAGQKGYLVRWKIATKSGTGGYVESLAFPSPADSSKIVVVRFGFDIDAKAPGLDVMDRITDGIKADSSGGSSGTGV